MPELIHTILDAGVGSRLRLAKKTDKRTGTLIGLRFTKLSRGLWLHIQFDDGKIETYWKPKEVRLLEKSPVYCSWDTGREWKVIGDGFPPNLVGIIYRRQRMTEELDHRGENVWVEVGFDIVRPVTDGDNSKRVCEGPYPLFQTALQKLLGTTDARTA